jgi:phosphoenolpyruvate-protein phosphotransferase
VKLLRGIIASPGIAIGPAFHFRQTDLSFQRHRIDDPAAEWARLEAALSMAHGQLAELTARAEADLGAEHAAILKAQALMLKDPELLATMRLAIEERGINAEAALCDAADTYVQMLASLDDEYLRARAGDVRDVASRLLRILLGAAQSPLAGLAAPSIILARDLAPSDTLLLDRALVLGFCTAEGGATSHTAILAKALGLPAVVGLGPALLTIPDRAPLVVDGERGEVITDTDERTRQDYVQARQRAVAQAGIDLQTAKQPAVTTDGRRVEVLANLGGHEDPGRALSLGAEGIGLLRTEFMFLDRVAAPTEEEQVTAYRAIFDAMGARPLVARTLDAGGDKALPYLDLGREANPFLGWRGIRLCLDRPHLFKAQLRALLRAGVGHDLRIMFPLVATLEELRQARDLLAEAKAEAAQAGHAVADRLQVGIMVEIPAVVVLADHFAREVDFFSIGSNDLTQYTMAADRTYDRLAHLSDACHPAVLRQVEGVITAAHRQGVRVGLCGELAGDPEAIPILLGLGLDGLSMAPPAIPRAKAVIRRWSMAAARALAHEVLGLDSATAVRERLRQGI